ncbi:DUF262 domain-containing protein [Nitrospira defluvii]|uniref:GmrSD restriction endonucleases N-terminal domain-containing protein n=1 Tax=Nitrospira defluvii TaxID=330214 RepID=A0ABM8RYT4_9BACT|nr:DUF262 domain-containing protein [Nitrospira defluvii]CAE6778816.1 conserved hypothetical protein [Nitrospira defluvii]
MADTEQKQSLITPKDITLRAVFGEQRSYFIDIYQREYKWKDEEVRTLLNDVEARFLQYDRPKTHPEDIKQDVFKRFDPYFLNTFLTHNATGNSSIVDGQQRLTTLLLILIKLYQVLKDIEKDSANKGRTFSSQKLEELIFESNDFGGVARFKIFNENRDDAFRALVEGRVVEAKDETRRRIKENFALISEYFDSFLKGRDGLWDLAKTTYYITYLLDRISIVEIRIERQDNVAMIFEVVNDRGLGLKPYEILKGKLIGGLPERQKEEANKTWTELQEKYFNAELRNTTEKSVDLDTFFRGFFRAKFADTETEYERLESDYHYEMYRNDKIRTFFGEFKDRDLLFKRITKDLKYFADLYLTLRVGYDNESVIFNKLLDQNQQYLLILSSIRLDDPAKKEKIEGIARKFDQMHVILRLLDAYDSNEFQRLIYPLFSMVRGKDITEAVCSFDKQLITTLVSAGVIDEGQHTTAGELFTYERFKGMSNKWLNFSKYVLMRIDRHLASVLNKPSFAGGNLADLENQFNRTGNRRHGMHLEHIYTQHPANRVLFTKDGVFDESGFQQTRNLLGMVLLLKDKHNLSSNDDIYRDKCDTYSKSNLVWNELLVGHLQNVDMRELPEELQLEKIEPTADGVFPKDKVEERQKATYAAIKAIWGFA